MVCEIREMLNGGTAENCFSCHLVLSGKELIHPGSELMTRRRKSARSFAIDLSWYCGVKDKPLARCWGGINARGCWRTAVFWEGVLSKGLEIGSAIWSGPFAS